MQQGYDLLWQNIGGEWLGVLCVFAASFLAIILTCIVVDHTEGWDAIGLAVILTAVRVIAVIAAGAFLFIGKALKLISDFHEELISIEPMWKRIFTNALIRLPILIYVLYVGIWAYVVFHRKIKSAFMRSETKHKRDENLSKLTIPANDDQAQNSAETADDEDKDYAMSPRDFIAILDERGLTEENGGYELMNAMNEKYQGVRNENNEEFFYTKAIMMPLRSSCVDDTFNRTKFWRHPTEKMWPAYIYNAILICPGKGEKLRYAPFARYAQHKIKGPSKAPFPYREDIYVECKLLCVDTQIYAIIGVGESLPVKKRCNSPQKLKPYYLILSEKESITTYVDGAYDKNGAIETCEEGFVMRGNKAKEPGYKRKHLIYPVRKVERIDIDTMNAVAAELQQLIGLD